MIADLTVTLLNSSTAHIKWNFQQEDFQHLNGKFRTFTVSIYKNFGRTIFKKTTMIFVKESFRFRHVNFKNN